MSSSIRLSRLVATGALASLMLFASPSYADDRVVMTGATDSPLAKKIQAELAALDLGGTPSSRVRVRLEADGGVTIMTSGAPPETIARDADEDLVARKVAESVRASLLAPREAEPNVEAKETAPSSPSVSAHAVAPAARGTVPPSHALVRRSSWLLSADDALPLFSIYGEGGMTSGAALRFGDPGGFAQVQPPRPLYIDYAVADRFTLGLAPVVEQTVNSTGAGSIHMAGAEIRAGYAFPLGPHLALWPHVGVSHLRGAGLDGAVTHRTAIVGDLKIAWTPNGRWALTIGPAIRFPVDFGMPRLPEGIVGSSSLVAYPIVNRPQLSLSAGLTVRLDEDEAPTPTEKEERGPRFLFGVERLVPLVRYRVEEFSTGDTSHKESSLDLGTADTTNRFPTAQRLAFDVVFGERVTVGVAASAGYVSKAISAEFAPSNGDKSFVFALAPRVGAWLPLSRRWSFWPRGGVTWVEGSTSSKYGGRYPNRHFGIDVDAFAVFSPVQGIGITAGPSLALPIAGSTEVYTPFSKDRLTPLNRTTADSSVLSIGLSAGLVLLL